jgi:putative oxidoreductase
LLEFRTMPILKSLVLGGILGNKRNTDAALLLLRFFVGLAFITIFEKLLPREGVWGPQPWFVDDVSKMGFPLPFFFAWAAVLSEFFGGFMLMLGLMARPAAFLNCVVTGVAAFLFHHGDFGQSGLAATMFFLMCTVILIGGPGAFSMDALLAKRIWRVKSVPVPPAS